MIYGTWQGNMFNGMKNIHNYHLIGLNNTSYDKKIPFVTKRIVNRAFFPQFIIDLYRCTHLKEIEKENIYRTILHLLA